MSTFATAPYGDVAYWDARYEQHDKFFDWYQKYDGLRDIIREFVKRQHRVLIVGTGRSRLPEEMARDGFGDVLSTDASRVAIESMRSHYGNNLRFEISDVTDLTQFSHSEFDAVIDKGCFDCVLCSTRSTERGLLALQQISRVLRPGGVFLSVSYNQPMFRVNFMERPENRWSVQVRCVPKTSGKGVHYVYVCVRNGEEFSGGETRRQAPPPPARNAFAPAPSVELATSESVAFGSGGRQHSQVVLPPSYNEQALGSRTFNRAAGHNYSGSMEIVSDGRRAQPMDSASSRTWARKQISKEPVYALDG